VGCLQDIDIKIIIHENGAAHRGDPNRFFPQLEIVNRLCHQSVGDAMVTSRAEMEWNINETFWAFEDKFHIYS
jgi:hypothetical protein